MNEPQQSAAVDQAEDADVHAQGQWVSLYEQVETGLCQQSESATTTTNSANSLVDESSSELHRESWMSVVVTPALSIHPVVPGEEMQILVEPVEGVAFVELSARLVGHSEFAFKHRHEILSVSASNMASVDPDAPTAPHSFKINLPRHQTCACPGRRPSFTTGVPLPPSYQYKGNRIEYALELSAKVVVTAHRQGKKGKGKWSLFGEKAESKHWSLPFNVQTDSLYDPSAPIPRPLAREQIYRTYPISQESFEGRRRISFVELREPRIVGLLTEIRNAKLTLEFTTSIDASHPPSRLQPSFKYVLLASLGRHDAATLPILFSSLHLATPYVHFVLHKSTASGNSDSSIHHLQRVVPLVHRQPLDRSGPPDAGLVHRDQPGLIDGVYDLIRGDDLSDGTTMEAFVKFEGELEVKLPRRGVEDANDEARLVPIRSCQLEVRYDLTATFQFGPDRESLVSLKSTNLALHLEPHELPFIEKAAASMHSTSNESNTDEKDKHFNLPSNLPTSSACPDRVSSTSQLPICKDLPAYGDGGEDSQFSTAEEKRQVAPLDMATSSSTAPDPPAYTLTSTRTAGVLAAAEDTDREAVEESPPSWDETVRDDMIDDWVAASVALVDDNE